MALRQTVRSQFQANRHEKDETKLETMKADAIRALSNYMLYQSAQKDTQLQNAMKEQMKNAQKDNDDER
jgi:hypothetical protein